MDILFKLLLGLIIIMLAYDLINGDDDDTPTGDVKGSGGYEMK